MKVKTRFAPSPTGYLHVGSARTALYSWLFARRYNGNFILRIEDTDKDRSESYIIEDIINSMSWLGLHWNKGPYFQTKRISRYNEVIDFLLKMGKAYKCYCSKKRLLELRNMQIKYGEKPRYDGYCRHIQTEDSSKSFVVRFKNPKEGVVVFDDQIRGQILFDNKELDDLIIRRTDGIPTYNFCSIIDDWDMEITHVIRGEDHINNTPRQINMLKALKAPIPKYAHLAMIHGDDGKKLSKRHGAKSVMQYRDEGYLPEALLNYLVRMGWSYGNKEIFSREEMIKLFSLSAISKSSSIFSTKKLLWMNHYYINNLPESHVAKYLKWHINKANININNGPSLEDLLNLLSSRYKTLQDIVKNCRYFYEDCVDINTEIAKKHLSSLSYRPLIVIKDKFKKIESWTTENIKKSLYLTIEKLSISKEEIYMPLRIAITGTQQSPALDLIIQIVGQKRTLLRIDKALNFIVNQEKKNDYFNSK